jgi:hypothetical protein
MASKMPHGAPPRLPRKNLEAALASHRILTPSLEEVKGYLDSHRKLATILPAICERTRREFGKEAELTLRVYHDPEIDDHYLSLYVRLPVYDDTTMERLDGVTQDFDDELCRTSGYLLLTTDFRPPRATHGV